MEDTKRVTPIRSRRRSGRRPKHGARLLQETLDRNQLDGRTKVARLKRELVDDLANDAGGWDQLTARERILVERAAAQALICQAIENWVFQQDSPIRESELLPVLRKGYTSHVANLTRTLAALGLRPTTENQIPSLAEYIEARDQSNPSQRAKQQSTSRDDT